MNPSPVKSVSLKGRARRFWWLAHQWLGLGAGVAFVLIGLTGSVLAVNLATRGGLDPVPMAVDTADTAGPGAAGLSFDLLAAAARAAMPQDSELTAIDLPLRPGRPVVVSYSVGVTNSDHRELRELFLHPRTAVVLGQRAAADEERRFSGSTMAIVTRLHHTLLLGALGSQVVAWMAMALAVSVISGLWLWWPPGGRLRHAFSFRWSAGPARRVYDLHRHAGVWFSAILLMSILSGLYMTWPARFERVANWFSPTRGWPEGVKSRPAEGRQPVSIDAAAAVASRLFPEGTFMGVTLPDGPEGSYCVRRRAPGEVTQSFTHRQVWVDQYSGEVRALTDPKRYSAGERFLEWQYPLHSGEAFGVAGHAVVGLSGLAPLLLFVTGVLRWRARRSPRG